MEDGEVTDFRLEERPTVAALSDYLDSRHGDLIQIQDAYGALSFAEVAKQSAILARGLLASGVSKGEKVGLLMPNGSDWVVAWFAISRIGAVAVLLSTFAKPPELVHMLRHSDVRTLLMSDRSLKTDLVERLLTALPQLAGHAGASDLYLTEAPLLRAIWMWGETQPGWTRGDGRSLAARGETGPVSEPMLAAVEAEVTPSDPGLIIYTSGTMSDPKAVLHSQGSVVRQACAMAQRMNYERGDRCLTTQPFFWVAGLCTSLLASNINGARLVCPPTPTPADTLRTLREHDITHITLWPAQFAALTASPNFRAEDFSRLKPNGAQQLALLGIVPQDRAPNLLGMSETFGPHSMEFGTAPLPPGKAGSFGRGVQTVERKIVDPTTGAVLGPGQEGEIFVRGHAMMLGFYKRERAEIFEPDGFYRTGDFGWIDEDGHLFFTGRRVEIIKTSGVNVSPREVEIGLLDLPGVLEAVAVGLPDAQRGELIVAAVVPKRNAILDEADLKAQLRERIADYKVPKRIVTLRPEEMPRTESGKIQIQILKRLLEERVRNSDRP